VRVTLIDYGAGNVTSVERALQRLGAESRRATTPECIENAERLLLPGVGHFGALIRALDERALRVPLLAALSRGIPFLGVCLGLQALYESSEEAPDLRGLGVLPGRVRALPDNVKLPHMGWNQVRAINTTGSSPRRLLDGIAPNAHFYFAHSYAATTSPAAVTSIATCTHGSEFIAVLEHQNLHAVQFHPEKSGAAGARLLRNFLRLAA
jgi:imidazole glycerol phosphate synthase glutamine amidotransferase subunit